LQRTFPHRARKKKHQAQGTDEHTTEDLFNWNSRM
jgi:hypothetical protein